MILKAQGAGLRPGDLWKCLRDIAAEHTGQHAGQISYFSPFIRQSVKR
jgi:hypothetical protein